MKKFVTFLIIAAIAAGSLTGCGEKTVGDELPNDSESAADAAYSSDNSESETPAQTTAATESAAVSAITEVSNAETEKATVASSYPEKQVVDILDSNGQNLTRRDYDSYFYTGDDISFTVLQDTLTETGIEYTLVNNFEELSSRLDWQLQKKIDGQWYDLNYISGEDEAIMLPVGTRTKIYNFGKYFGSLEPGEYRVIFSAITEPDENSEIRYGFIFLSSEFTVPSLPSADSNIGGLLDEAPTEEGDNLPGGSLLPLGSIPPENEYLRNYFDEMEELLGGWRDEGMFGINKLGFDLTLPRMDIVIATDSDAEALKNELVSMGDYSEEIPYYNEDVIRITIGEHFPDDMR